MWRLELHLRFREVGFVVAHSSVFAHVDSGNGSRHYTVKLHHISEALIASGYTTLDDQAKALGINRSTAWTIIKTKHKLGRLSTKTTERILANPATPASVRALVQRYLAERSDTVESQSPPVHHV